MFAHSQDFRFRLFPKIFPLILAALALAFHPADKAANAQAADETAKRFNYLPLVADGEGIRSTLLITNVADSVNSCSLVFWRTNSTPTILKLTPDCAWTGQGQQSICRVRAATYP